MSSPPLTSFATPPPPSGQSVGVTINLDLEIGVFACASEGVLKRNIHEKIKGSFTSAQIHELCYQIFISNSIAHASSIKGEKCDHSSVMDSEPGRCRRTDGRKWRCTKTAIPLQKYCQRHMHRGSRKHVEPIQKPDNRASVASDIGARVSTSCRCAFPLILKCRNDETSSSSISVDYGRSAFSSSRADCFKPSFDGNTMSLSRRKHNFVGSNYVGFDSSRYGLSPKSVLGAAGKVGLGSGQTSSTMEPEPRRCRRTDGKKWQCRREAIHSQKYCEAHMHRGAKRVLVKPEYSSHLQSTPTISRNLDSGINLNTVPECSQHGTSNNSCSSSDATTVTD